MDSKFPSRAWSCQTIQRGLDLARDMSLNLGACNEPDLAAMELELAQLQVAGEWTPDFLPSAEFLWLTGWETKGIYASILYMI